MEFRRFGGLRPDVLRRDGECCQGCGRAEALVVHHRRRINEARYLLSLCRRCHARIHHTCRPRFGAFNPRLRQLWREQHPDLAEQFELALLGDEAGTNPDQLELFRELAAVAAA